MKCKGFFWKNNRDIQLEGEAFFSVLKGTTFKVISNAGTVTVLGTSFNIKDREIYELNCYSGKVQFIAKNKTEKSILEKGDKITMNNTIPFHEKFSKNSPNWMQEISIYKDKPLSMILKDLERQFSIKIESNKADLTKLFTGSFSHKNIENALKTTLRPMGIKYSISKDKKTISLQ